MRRALASLLLALFSFPLVEPVLRAENAGNLPACCRREGLHHCAMPAPTTDAATPSAQAECPQFPKVNGIEVSFSPVLLSAPPQTCAPFVRFFAAHRSNDSLPQIALRGCVRKRGPPSSLA